MIRPLSCSLTTVLLPPKCHDATQGMASGCHTPARTTRCFESNHTLLRVEPRAASSRITRCFESNHALLRVEPHFGKLAQHVRRQRRRGMNHFEPACQKTALAEEQDTLPSCPPPCRLAVGGSAWRGEGYTVLPVKALGDTGGESGCCHRVTPLSLKNGQPLLLLKNIRVYSETAPSCFSAKAMICPSISAK